MSQENNLQNPISVDVSSIPSDSLLFSPLVELIAQIDETYKRYDLSHELQTLQPHISALIQHISAVISDKLRSEKSNFWLTQELSVMNVDNMVLQVSEDWYLLDANQRFAEISGYSVEELRWIHTREFNSGFHPPEFWKEFYSTIGSWKIWHGDICNKKKDGSEFWLRTTVKPIVDIHWKILQYLVVRQDITTERYLKRVQDDYKIKRIDPVTWLPWKLALFELLEVIENQLLIIVHLDGMSKFHTDPIYGSIGWDDVLSQIGILLPNICSRIGGEVYKLDWADFWIFFTNPPDATIIESLIWVINKMSCYLNDEKIPLTFSHSVTMSTTKWIEIFRRAYQAIKGDDSFNKHSPEFSGISAQKIVEKAFEWDLFFPVYQEIHKITKPKWKRKFEALARMRHPVNGTIIFPGDFLEAVEELRYQKRFTRNIIEKACQYITRKDYDISFNITQEDLSDSTFVVFIQAMCVKYYLQPQQLTFEILENIDSVANGQPFTTLQALMNMGCKISVDDFWTDKAWIKRFTTARGFHFLKIAREYVTDIDKEDEEAQSKRLLVEIAVFGAKKCWMQVIAEWVETQEEYLTLLGLWADYTQGYYFSKPVPYIIDSE